jgi:hypothetical protein
MHCQSCCSENQEDFPAEVNVHFPGLKDLDRPTVWAFPRLRICLDCGFTEFRMEDSERQQLSEPTRRAPTSSGVGT